ncbi:hypothetical protein BS47DRAFT_1290845 [Hydnum rufescens UP504]|uniref:NAD(P)-binding protein n=1 Tax=Hydnum rufescens UP504 TaxID=1448309 RepID=A0A9P6B4H2_9AGAM|nr:hypothetical protein BS47DRAFT_1290845 [Hydnum rufescens UP504]
MGSLFSSPGFDPKDIPNLAGKRIVVTGGNSGIGYHTVKHLVHHGATVWMACRNARKAEDAKRRLDEYFATLGLRLGHDGVGEVKLLACDLSTPAGAKAAAAELMSKENRLDILSMKWGSFVFTLTLLPLLSKTSLEQNSDVRIVNLSSETHRLFVPSNLQFKSIEDFNVKYGDSAMNDLTRYATSKLATVLFTAELQRVLDQQNIPILTTCLHPGVVVTGMRTAFFAAIWGVIATLFWMSADEGSFTSLFAATSPEIRSHPGPFRGRYMVPYGKPADTTRLGEDKQLARDLWVLSERLANQTSKP